MRWRALTAVLVVAGTLGQPLDAAGAVQAGAAYEPFVLPRWVPLAGYSRRHGEPSSGVHDPVGVRALVVRDAKTTAALVSCDLLIVDERLFTTVRRRLVAQGLPEDLVLILAATHTHSGPGAYGSRFLEKLSMGHFNPAVFDALVEAITQAVIRAAAHQLPVRMAYASALTEGLLVNRVDPTGFADAEVTVCVFYQERTSAPLAVIVNFAAHPTTLGAWNTQLSADYPGVIVREVERQFPGTTCLFFAGSVGDQGPVKSGDGFARAERVGGALATQALALLHQAAADPPDAVHALMEQMPLPPARVRLGRRLTLPRWMGQRLVDDDATLSMLTVGKTAFFGVPCDLTAALGRDLKEAARSRGLHPMVIGFANDYVGYCVSEASYQAKQYESYMAFNGPTTGRLVVEHLTHLLERVVTSDERVR